MQIKASWSKPIALKKLPASALQIYSVNLEQVPENPGVYVFARKHGNSVFPIYIGETMSLRARVKTHLNSLPLMKAIENAPNGGRFLIYCTVDARAKDKAKKQIKVLERVLILHAQGEGHALFNKKGTKLPTDTISFVGNRTSESIAPRTMLIKRTLGRGRVASSQR